MTRALILIVEDNPKNLKLIRDVLQFRGYQTLEANSAEAGIELARAHQPELILMDVLLPGLDGCEAMKILKADVSTRQIPVIAVTSFAMKGDRENLLSSGFNGYISKPIDIKEFPTVVEGYLTKQDWSEE